MGGYLENRSVHSVRSVTGQNAGKTSQSRQDKARKNGDRIEAIWEDGLNSLIVHQNFWDALCS